MLSSRSHARPRPDERRGRSACLAPAARAAVRFGVPVVALGLVAGTVAVTVGEAEPTEAAAVALPAAFEPARQQFSADVDGSTSRSLSELGQAQASASASAAADKAAADKAAADKAAADKAAAEKAAADKAAADRAAAAQAAAQQRAQAAAQAARSAARDPRSLARSMAASRGWGDGQFSCLDALWQKESGWNPSAANPSSGAYGIPQALPGSKMSAAGSDWRSNPATQIEWGLDYIASTYGTPCGAWAHSRAVNWY